MAVFNILHCVCVILVFCGFVRASLAQQEVVTPAPVPIPEITEGIHEYVSKGLASLKDYKRIGFSHELTLLQTRLKGASFKPTRLSGNKGLLVPSESLLQVSDSKPTKSEYIWELGPGRQSKNNLSTALDTEIVGGDVRQDNSDLCIESFDLLISVSETYGPNVNVTKHLVDGTVLSRTTQASECELKWYLTFSNIQKNRSGALIGCSLTGSLVGSHKQVTTRDYGNGSSSVEIFTTTYQNDGKFVISAVTTTAGNEGSQYISESTTTYFPEGRRETVTRSKSGSGGGDAGGDVRTDKCEAFTLDQNWFEMSISKNQRHEFNPCDDAVFRRLVSEDYSDEVLEKLKELSPGYNLQPLGSHGDVGVTQIGSPYANYDRYSVTIPSSRLPVGFSPEAELASWPANMNNVPKPGSVGASQFSDVNLFKPLDSPAKPGSVIEISIPGAYQVLPTLLTGRNQNVAVMITDIKPGFFRVSTLEREVAPGVRLRHPVSGSREFGFEKNADGSITFYTQGLDSPNSNLVNWKGDLQTVCWKGFMSGLGEKFGLSRDEAEESVNEGSFSNQPLQSKPDCQ